MKRIFEVEPAPKAGKFKFVVVDTRFTTSARYVKWFKTREEADAAAEKMNLGANPSDGNA